MADPVYLNGRVIGHVEPPDDKGRIVFKPLVDSKGSAPKGKRWVPIFLHVFADTGIARAAAQAAGVSTRTVRRTLKTDKKFAKRYRHALDDANQALEMEARRRAVSGVPVPRMYKGEVVTTVQEYSDRLMEKLLEANMPDKYGRNASFLPDLGDVSEIKVTFVEPPKRDDDAGPASP